MISNSYEGTFSLRLVSSALVFPIIASDDHSPSTSTRTFPFHNGRGWTITYGYHLFFPVLPLPPNIKDV